MSASPKDIVRVTKGVLARLSELHIVADPRSVPCPSCDGVDYDGCLDCLGVGFVIPVEDSDL